MELLIVVKMLGRLVPAEFKRSPARVPPTTVKIFAYGSNLHLQRMCARVPSARPIAIGFVTHYRISFHKRSVDGSAKADACYTADPDDRVWGVIYEIDSDEKPILDRYEFLGTGYELEAVEVVASNRQPIEAMIYVALPEAIDHDCEPYYWYLQFVIRGAVQHRLPYCYTQSLLNVPSQDDPDEVRRRVNLEILASVS